MCGIVGYIGKQNVAEILLEGLRKLEYRGYDSAGIAVFGEKGIVTEKAAGRISNLEAKLASDGTPKGHAGIGHTRWATHGEPSDVNSHPHTCGRVTLVHNGIIENYVPLKSALLEAGRTFLSSTDTEVAAQLIDYYYSVDREPIDAISLALSRIRGSYALAVMFSDIPDKLFAVRRDSPLIVGVGAEGEGNYIASDIPAILSRTRNYYLIGEDEVAIVASDWVEIVDFMRRPVKKELLTADWDIEAAEKAGYPHFMLKEIHEQPKTLRATIQPRLSDGPANILRSELPDTLGVKRLIIVACGSAMHTGLLGKIAIEKLSRVKVDVVIASEFRYCDPILEKGDVVLVISQSGETADSIAALRLAKSRGIPVWAVVNVVGSSIAREADKTIYTWAGPEIAVATTKAYTAQVAVLYMLAMRLAIDRGRLGEGELNRLAEELHTLPDKVEEVLSDENVELYQHLASLNQNVHDMFFIGRGQDYALCCEGSLKLKEISYMHSEAYAAGELKHGTISLVTEGVPVIASATSAALMEKTVSNVKEVKARGAFVIFFCRRGEVPQGDFCDKLIELPPCEELFTPILAVVPMQTYAYYTAVYKGCDVDKPRNLAKSVTVE